MRPIVRALIQSDWCPYKKRKQDHKRRDERDHTQGEAVGGRKEKAASANPERTWEETTAPDTSVLDFEPPVSGRDTFCLSHGVYGIWLRQSQQTGT